MINVALILKNWKFIAIVAMVIGLGISIFTLRSKYHNEQEKVEQLRRKISKDSLTILALQREVIYFKEDTAQLRYTLIMLLNQNQDIQKKDKENNKGLSSKLPSIDRLKNK